MNPDISKKNEENIFRDLFVVFLLGVLLITIIGLFVYPFYEKQRLADCIEKECIAPMPVVYTAYGYYGVNDFLMGNNITGNAYIYDVQPVDFVYNKTMKKWLLKNQINKTIHFNISGIEGDFTPDISVVNDTLYTDIIIINRYDTIQNGSCYIIGTMGEYSPSDTYYYNRSLRVGLYDEIPIRMKIKIPSDDDKVVQTWKQLWWKNCSQDTTVQGGPIEFRIRTFTE